MRNKLNCLNFNKQLPKHVSASTYIACFGAEILFSVRQLCPRMPYRRQLHVLSKTPFTNTTVTSVILIVLTVQLIIIIIR